MRLLNRFTLQKAFAALLLLASNSCLLPVGAQLGTTTTSSDSTSSSGVVHNPTKRTGHIDVLDEETLLYYLDAPSLDYDVVVFYYATWCKNCKALSPIYGKIAELVRAGTTQSKVVMAYFDCEANYEHATVCSKAGITHYPTLHFYSFSGQQLSRDTTRPKHIAAFPGNWQQGEAIMDWIKVMSFLSRWHRAGWGAKLRGWLFGGNKRRNKATASTPLSSSSSSSSTNTNGEQDGTQLPVGIPHQAANERKVESLQKSAEEIRTIALRTSTFVDSVLFPVTFTEDLQPIMTDAHGGRYTDVFGVLTEKNLWDKQKNSDHDAMATVLRTCVMEATLSICDRLSVRVTERWLEQQGGELSKISDDALRNYETDTAAAIKEQEPFCAGVEECILNDYQPAECRPTKCPFTDPTLCRYVTACLTDQLQKEYAAALGLTLPSMESIASSFASSSSATPPIKPQPPLATATRGAATEESSSTTPGSSAKDDEDTNKPPAGATNKGWGVA